MSDNKSIEEINQKMFVGKTSENFYIQKVFMKMT